MTVVLLPAVSGTRTWSIVDTDGVEHALSAGTSYLPTMGPSGLWVPEFDFSTDPYPFDVGSDLKRVSVRPRVVDFPIYIMGTTELQIHERIRALIRWLNATDGDSYLRVTSPDGAQRQLKCRGTVQVSETPDARHLMSGQMVIATLTCPQPYWEDAVLQTATYTVDGTPSTWFDRPWFPFLLASSTVLDTPSIDNSGDIDTYPTWTITGPGSDPVVRNLTTGKVLGLDRDISAGGQVLIDTGTGAKSITDAYGTNLFGDRTVDSTLWPLVRGVQTIQIELSGATVDSEVVMSYRRRFLSP